MISCWSVEGRVMNVFGWHHKFTSLGIKNNNYCIKFHTKNYIAINPKNGESGRWFSALLAPLSIPGSVGFIVSSNNNVRSGMKSLSLKFICVEIWNRFCSTGLCNFSLLASRNGNQGRSQASHRLGASKSFAFMLNDSLVHISFSESLAKQRHHAAVRGSQRELQQKSRRKTETVQSVA